MKGILTMSQREVDRLTVIKQLEDKNLRIEEAVKILGISERQTYRILKRIRDEGSKGVIHRSRGKKSNHGYPEELKKRVIKIYNTHYKDYGPTLFSEELEKKYRIPVNHETLRRWMRQRAITTSMRKNRPHRRKRERRNCLGELLQFDGSHHDWFEGRGPECCLFNCVDDSTGRIYLYFAPTENTADAMITMWEYSIKNGIPRSIYTDRHSVYYAENKLTDFGRAMKELDVEIIFAKSAQAKGRVENRNRTLQDRLAKALRQEKISTIAEANKFVKEKFIEEFNEKFAINPNVPDIHRSVKGIDLENIFCYKTTRQVRNDYTINLSGGYIQLLKSKSPLPRPKQDVTIIKRLDNTLYIYFNNQELKFSYINGKPVKKGYKVRKPAKDHPWRKMNNNLPGRRDFPATALG
jgi:transposase